MILAIDASYSVTGGSLSQLIQFIDSADPIKHKFNKIILFAHPKTLKLIKDKKFLVKESIPFNSTLVKFIYNFFIYKKLNYHQCDILLIFGGTSFCRFLPKISIAHNLLPFDKNILDKYFYNYEWINYFKFHLLRFMQIRNFNKSNGIIFFHKFTKYKIFKSIKKKNYNIIPPLIDLKNIKKKIKKNVICYITNYQLYKNDLQAVKALYLFAEENDYKVYFVGKQKGKHFEVVKNYLNNHNNNNIELVDEIHPLKVLDILRVSKIFLLASSCENFSVSLLEAIATKNFILSSNRQPMKNILRERAIYFNEFNYRSIYSALEKYLVLSKAYKEKCIKNLYNEVKNKNNSNLIVRDIFKYLKKFL
jgi:hypothetical protein